MLRTYFNQPLAWLVSLLACVFLAAPDALAQPEGESHVKVTLFTDRDAVSPGGQFAVAVVFDHDTGWHVQSNDPAPDFIPTRIELTPNPSVKQGAIQWPPVEKLTQGSGKYALELKVFAGHAVAFVPLVADPSASGSITLKFKVSYQSCDDQICMPEEEKELEAKVRIVPVGDPSGLQLNKDHSETFKNFDASVFSRILAGEVASATSDFDAFGRKFKIDSSAYVLILAIAFFAGFLLNFTPCVLPVIPLKALSLQQQAGNKAKLTLFGTAYCLGIIATFLVLGLLIFGIVTGGQKQDWGQIFTNKWFTITMSVVVFVMGLGMMGLFTMRLPDSLYMLNPSHDSVLGNFLMGALTGILSTPCTGPFLGATIAWAAKQPAWLGLLTLVVMGIGMAAPYAALIAFPKLVDRLPKSGPGGELLKQVLGIFLIAVAAFLASNLVAEPWTWYVIGGLGALASLWAIVGAWRMLRSHRAKVITTVCATLALAITVVATRSLAYEGPISWKKFRNRPDAEIQEAIKKANAEGHTVVIDFTARWCSNCHVIEKTVLNSDEGVALLTRPNVRPFKVDLSQAGENQGWGTLKGISGGGGIPVIAVFRPGAAKPIFFNSFFPISDLVAAVDGKS